MQAAISHWLPMTRSMSSLPKTRKAKPAKNSSNGTSVGVGINLGGSQSGFSLEFSANQARGKADGIDTFYTNSYVSAGKTATIISGGDLEDSSLSISDVAQFIQRKPVDKLESLIIIKDGKVVLLKGI